MVEANKEETNAHVAEVRLELEAALSRRMAPLLQLQMAVEASEAAAAAGGDRRTVALGQPIDSARGADGEFTTPVRGGAAARRGLGGGIASPGGVRVEAEAAYARREAAAAEDRAAAREALEKRLKAKSERAATGRAEEAAQRSRSRQSAAYLVP